MGRSGYTSLSIEQKRYARLKRGFDQTVKPNTNNTFTVWAMNCLEASIERQKFLNANFKELKLAAITSDSVIIEDKDKVVKVQIKNGSIISSDPDEKYVRFALIQPDTPF